MSQISVAALQFNSITNNINSNLNSALALINSVPNDTSIIVLPELSLSGYCADESKFGIDLSSHENALKDQRYKTLFDIATQRDCFIIACEVEQDGKNTYDTAFIISKDGLIGKQRKIFLWQNESKRFKRGKKQKLFNLTINNQKVKIGIGICYEIGFGEIARKLALDGANLLIYPSAFGNARGYAWDLASRARALENGSFLIACNSCGSNISEINGELLEFYGHSKIIDPKGNIISQLDNSAGAVIASIDLSEVKIQRDTIPYLKDIKKFKKSNSK